MELKWRGVDEAIFEQKAWLSLLVTFLFIRHYTIKKIWGIKKRTKDQSLSLVPAGQRWNDILMKDILV
jgi:hypothetical protein